MKETFLSSNDETKLPVKHQPNEQKKMWNCDVLFIRDDSGDLLRESSSMSESGAMDTLHQIWVRYLMFRHYSHPVLDVLYAFLGPQTRVPTLAYLSPSPFLFLAPSYLLYYL